MKVNIFGVGRSGTKVVQLYACLAFLEKFEKCRVNYEPFYWKSRKCKKVSKKGVTEHLRLPLLIHNSSYKKYKSDFLKQISKKSHIPLVSKFIRGNGRIGFISEQMKVKKNILIIRPLPKVLNSLKGQGWDFLGKGLRHENDWNKFKKELYEDRTDRYIQWLGKINEGGEIGKNALYWAVMNDFALQYFKRNKSDNLIIDFTKIRDNPHLELGKISKFLNLPYVDYNFNNISGNKIHNEEIITGVKKGINLLENSKSFLIKNNLHLQVFKRLCNLIYKLKESLVSSSPEIVNKNKNIGCLKSKHQIGANNAKASKVNYFYEELNNYIYNRIENIRKGYANAKE